jgi:hypothetical protein
MKYQVKEIEKQKYKNKFLKKKKRLFSWRNNRIVK